MQHREDRHLAFVSAVGYAIAVNEEFADVWSAQFGDDSSAVGEVRERSSPLHDVVQPRRGGHRIIGSDGIQSVSQQ